MIKFYPTVSRGELPYLTHNRVLLTASSFAAESVRRKFIGLKSKRMIARVNLPSCVTDDFRDCGGFVATFKWGDYQYSPEEYIEWLLETPPHKAAMMDYCCEEELQVNKGVVRERQQKTTDMAHYFWDKYKDVSWQWIPTIQGWYIKEYLYHAEQMKPLLYEMRERYGSAMLVGIGTLCHRANPKMVHSVVCRLSESLPDVNFHLWGTKKTVLTSEFTLPENIYSVDSAAFNGMYGKGREEWKLAIKPDGSRYKQSEYSLQVKLFKYMEEIKMKGGNIE